MNSNTCPLKYSRNTTRPKNGRPSRSILVCLLVLVSILFGLGSATENVAFSGADAGKSSSQEQHLHKKDRSNHLRRRDQYDYQHGNDRKLQGGGGCIGCFTGGPTFYCSATLECGCDPMAIVTTAVPTCPQTVKNNTCVLAPDDYQCPGAE